MAATDEDVERAGYKVARFLGYGCLKSDQRVVLREALKPHDVFAILPTGYSYACLPLMYDKLFHDQ